MKKLLTTLALVAVVSPAWAATRTVTLSVPGMTCAACPITVRHALTRVAGVEKTEVRFEQREAVVTFDDGKTNVQALTKATTDAGYPSSVKH
ncbi:mercury resistance system periplasmic binding protein MerP [Burkholderia cenocepacia]|uniref:mercury resistance system periplasmic binding protein MerP n=1 Tax=Burkholderia cenocepacia TaxID=95486 RepID=UPI0024B66760|nr:mercury resistance system periplasmic binding protein MerP [Burkholderia cenocepacia]MDI9700800.1 mercury resistance system periplasmic binding protein MerP [Burkholderia cenocepacia]